MTAASRFGGWLRLWVVLTAIYAVVVTAGAIWTAPYRKAVTTEWNQEIFRTLERDVKRITGMEISATQFRDSKEFRNKSDEQIAREMTQAAKDIDLKKPDKKDLGQYQKEIASVANLYEEKLERLRTEQAKHAGSALLIWLIPSLCMLVLGYAVAWVIRGFRKA